MRSFLPFAALLGVAFVLGCQDVGTGVVGPQLHVSEKHPNGHGGGGGDPTEPDATVELTEGLITLVPQGVQIRKDNASTLQVRRDGFSSRIALNATFMKGLDKCGQTGGGGDDEGLLLPEDVFALINDGSVLSRWFVARFDKHDPDGEHWIRYNWEDGADPTLDFGIGGLLKGSTAPRDTGYFSLNPRATVVTDGDVSTITFAKNHGIVTIKQRHLGWVLQCPLRDDIVIVVDRN